MTNPVSGGVPEPMSKDFEPTPFPAWLIILGLLLMGYAGYVQAQFSIEQARIEGVQGVTDDYGLTLRHPLDSLSGRADAAPLDGSVLSCPRPLPKHDALGMPMRSHAHRTHSKAPAFGQGAL